METSIARLRGLAAAVLVGTVALLLPPVHAQAASPPRELWMYEGANLADGAAMPRIEALWRRAAAAGYSKVVLVDPKFARLADQDLVYFSRIAALRSLAASLKLEIVPGVCVVGRGNGGMLAVDPNLAEALPVRDALFEVRGGIAHPVADPPVALAAKPDRVDAGIAVENGSARMSGGTTGRVAFELDVAPWRCYHVALRLAGESFRGEPRVRVTGNGRELAFASVAAPKTGAPEARDVVFNSLANRHVTVWFSLSRSSTGTLAWSDWRIEEPGPVNAVRRPGLEFRFAGLTEGRDYDAVADPLLGMRPWKGQFDAWHDPPVIRVRKPDGTRLRGSWQQAAVVGRGQVAVCLADTAVLAQLRDEVTRVRQLFGARTLFLMHDEIRAIGQDASCAATGRTAAQILAANVRACRSFAGNAGVCVWNDMFDPNQNAVDGYYLASGDLKGSWEGLDRDMTVVNWDGEHAEPSLRFFAERGHAQVWAGYYDGRVDEIRTVLPLLDRTPNVTGIMYTTWQDRYDDLEAFARICRGQ